MHILQEFILTGILVTMCMDDGCRVKDEKSNLTHYVRTTILNPFITHNLLCIMF